MRIIGGDFKGKNIKILSSFKDRPTTDFAREALFNILNNYYYFEDLTVLDLFAGTGAISFEFASRGTKNITTVDNNKKYIDFIGRQATEIFGDDIINTITADVFEFLKNHHLGYDLIFADPPYKMDGIEKIPELVFENKYIQNDCLFILEHSKYYNFKENKFFKKEKKYGHVHFSFFEIKHDE